MPVELKTEDVRHVDLKLTKQEGCYVHSLHLTSVDGKTAAVEARHTDTSYDGDTRYQSAYFSKEDIIEFARSILKAFGAEL